MYVITDSDMIGNTDSTSQNATFAYHHAPGDTHTRHNGRALTHLYVVADLNQVIDYYTAGYCGITNRAPVYCGCCPNLNIIPNSQAAELGNPDPAPLFVGVAKAITAQHCPALDKAALAD
jgi:hypothetical protein